MNDPNKTSSNRPARAFGFSVPASVPAAYTAASAAHTTLPGTSLGLRSQPAAAANVSRPHSTTLATANAAFAFPQALRPAANWTQSSTASGSMTRQPHTPQPAPSSSSSAQRAMSFFQQLNPSLRAAASPSSAHLAPTGTPSSLGTSIHPSPRHRPRSSSPSPLHTAAAADRKDPLFAPPRKRQRLDSDDDHDDRVSAGDVEGDRVGHQSEDAEDSDSDDSGGYPSYFAHFSGAAGSTTDGGDGGGGSFRFPWNLGGETQVSERGAFDGLLLADLQAEREKEEAEAAAAKLAPGEPRTQEENMERLVAKLDVYRVQDVDDEDSDNGSVVDVSSDQGQVWRDLILCVQHTPLVSAVTATLPTSPTTSHVHLAGTCIRTQSPLAFSLPISSLSNVHIKHGNADVLAPTPTRGASPMQDPTWMVSATVADSIFIQLSPTTSTHVQSGDTLAAALQAAIHRTRTPRTPTNVADTDPPGELPESPPAAAAAAAAAPAAPTPRDLVQAMAAELALAAQVFEAKVREIRERYAAQFAAAAAAAVVVLPVAMVQSRVPAPPSRAAARASAPATPLTAVSAAQAPAPAPAPAMCAICCDLNVEIELDPCGHEMCRVCWSRLERAGMCPFDRMVGVKVKGGVGEGEGEGERDG